LNEKQKGARAKNSVSPRTISALAFFTVVPALMVWYGLVWFGLARGVEIQINS